MSAPPRPPDVAAWCRDLDRRLRAGEPARAEDYLRDPRLDPEAAIEVVYTEFVCREELGPPPDPADFLRRFPALRDPLAEQFLVHRAIHDPPAAPARGQAVGQYDLVREVGRGGRGVVFEARDRRDGTPVAVKLLLSGEYATAADLALFRHEAAVLARLDHPHLIRILDAGEADGRPYLALEFVDGPPLSQAMTDFRQPRAAAALVETLARAVHHAHRQGVVHRDLKPSNILLAGGTPKVTDFGLSRLLDDGGGRTRTGDIVGTLGYMAPEQAAGTAHRAGPAADVYALGAVLYELLAGRPPFGPAPTAATLHQLLHEPPAPPRRLAPGVPADLETVTLKCLEKAPDARYPTALALADDLRRVLDGKPVAARRLSAVETARRWARRRPTAAALVAVVALAAAGLTAGGLHYNARLRAALADADAANAGLTAALADADALRADTRRQLDDTRRVLFAHQLAQLPAVWLRDPIRARALLADPVACPPDLRDFTWRHFRHLCGLAERDYDAHRGGTRAVAFLPDGRLVSGGADGRLRYWPAPESAGPPGPSVAAHAGPVAGLAVLAGGTVATAGPDRLVKLWAAGMADPLRAILAPAAVAGLAADPAGRRLAGACGDGAVRVWDADTGHLLATLTGPPGPLAAVALGPDGHTVAAGGADGAVRVWHLGRPADPAVWAGHTGPVLGLAFAPDGGFVASTSERGEVRVWDARTGAGREFRGHLMPVRAAAVSPDGGRLATGGGDTYLKVWDAATGQELTNLMRQDVAAVAWSPDGRWLAAGGRDGRVTVRRLPAFPPPPAFPHPANVGSLAARPGGGVVTADAAGEVRVWDAGGAAPVARFAVCRHDLGPARPQAVVGGGAPSLAVSPDGTTLAVGAGKGEVVLWDFATRAEVGRLRGHDGNVAAVAFDPAGRRLVSGGADATVRVWDLPTRTAVHTLTGHRRGVLAVAWSPAGDTLASGGEDNLVRLWDPATGQPGPELAGHSLWVLALAFDPAGRVLASGGRDRTVRLWPLAPDRKPQVLAGYTNWVYGVQFSPDGRTLAAASGHYAIDSPGEVKLCDPVGGSVRAILTGVRAPAAFDPAGRRLFVGVAGGVAELDGP